ncbi:hypothetical protein [Xanthomonas vasicola]|uniref:hypothetical protein n=1 Tax=Xanthomonas vasicola TaxID=56459 RepID=UPI0001CC0B39|nr:hypothetical protein [Xanthomonas vasicola]AZR31581.1 hypothetical protein KWO_014685 [Xanthomonas vasicola pv. musacearum NCPPB 4379]KFA06150.1 hypothetical protein KWM_0117470 [Xanthomonas vasicola pv. musacearum NCPPB 2005]KFA09129.1 hypothetical protein KWQ_0113280 [Xanthomonas vasicola pv. musacearum NCPPB 4380]KFA17464.1 hypothetical protein A11G_0114400 [Xanthomonas vasicola pv. musacearum NCPPB 4392]KFA17688.1 hypothetical protein KWU_0120640 [Xanthomonas vasicola pv. musacearum NCP
MQTIAFMTLVALLKRLILVTLACAATSTAASATTAKGPENSTLHIGLRLLSGCELRTTPPHASCSRGTPMAIAEPVGSSEASSVTSTGQDASALAGPAPAGSARITTIAF